MPFGGLLTGLKHPVGGYLMLKGYLSKVPIDEDVGKFVSRFQKKMFFRKLREVLL